MKHPFIVLIAATAVLSASTAMAQTAREVLGPAAVVPLAEQQPPAKIIVDPPLTEPLAHGLVFIQYRAENPRIVPVFGPNALDVSPRIGHIVPAITSDGAADGNYPASDGSATAAKFRGPRTHRRVPDAGHNLPQEAPSGINGKAEHFVAYLLTSLSFALTPDVQRQ